VSNIIRGKNQYTQEKKLTKAVIRFMEGIKASLNRFTGKVIIDGKSGDGEKVLYQLNFHNGNMSKRTKQLTGWKDD